MAANVHDSIRLDVELSGIVPTNEYRVVHSGLNDLYEPAMTMDRSLTGDLHVHRIVSGGTHIKFENYKYTLLLTKSEKDRLVEDLGRIVYFMQHYRDESDSGYRQVMLFKSLTDVSNIDPMLEYWLATIELEEANGQSV